MKSSNINQHISLDRITTFVLNMGQSIDSFTGLLSSCPFKIVYNIFIILVLINSAAHAKPALKVVMPTITVRFEIKPGSSLSDENYDSKRTPLRKRQERINTLIIFCR